MSATPIRYAGFDPNEGKPKYYRESAPRSGPMLTGATRAERMVLMSRSGRDTHDIASSFNVPEHRVLKIITLFRSKAKSLPSPYEARS